MKEINLSKCRWMLFTKSGLVVENHNQGITWKNTYKHNFGAMQALCFQMIPSGGKVFVKESPFGDYWTFEEFEMVAGQSIPTHMTRNICSLQTVSDNGGIKEGLWEVVSVDAAGKSTRSVMTDKQIGYEVRNFLNENEKERIRKFG